MASTALKHSSGELRWLGGLENPFASAPPPRAPAEAAPLAAAAPARRAPTLGKRLQVP